MIVSILKRPNEAARKIAHDALVKARREFTLYGATPEEADECRTGQEFRRWIIYWRALEDIYDRTEDHYGMEDITVAEHMAHRHAYQLLLRHRKGDF